MEYTVIEQRYNYITMEFTEIRHDIYKTLKEAEDCIKAKGKPPVGHYYDIECRCTSDDDY